jgi:hypothetical protein
MKNKTIAYGLMVAIALSSATPTLEAKPSKAMAAFEIAAGIVGAALTPCLLVMAASQFEFGIVRAKYRQPDARVYLAGSALSTTSAVTILILSALSIKNGIQKLNKKKKKIQTPIY